jgi:hypothetical protein
MPVPLSDTVSRRWQPGESGSALGRGRDCLLHHRLPDSDADGAALRHGVAGVAGQVQYHRLEFGAVALGRGQRRRQVHFQADARPQHAGQAPQPVQRHPAIEALPVLARMAGKIQHAAHQLGPAPGRIPHQHGQAPHLGGIAGAAGQQQGGRVNRLDQVVEIMRDAGGDLAQRADLFRLAQSRLGGGPGFRLGGGLHRRRLPPGGPLRRSGCG